MRSYDTARYIVLKRLSDRLWYTRKSPQQLAEHTGWSKDFISTILFMEDLPLLTDMLEFEREINK
jgi:hypothetical protein